MDFFVWKYQTLYPRMAKTLTDLGYGVHEAGDAAQAREKVMTLMPRDQSIGFGGSQTLNQLGIVDHLRAEGYPILDRFKASSFEEDLAIRRQSLTCHTFLTGVNAITRDGKLLFTDSAGNRPAAVLFGPEHVVIVAGMNKIVADEAAGRQHIREIAPMNCLRNGHKTPCTLTGECMDCHDQQRMCNSLTIIDNCLKWPGRIQMVLVAQALGF